MNQLDWMKREGARGIRGVAPLPLDRSRRATILAFLAGVVLIVAVAFGFVGSASASEGETDFAEATSKPTLTKQWWKKNNRAIKLITKKCKYRPAYRLLIKIRKPGLAVRGYLHMGWLAMASYGVSKTYGVHWKKPSKKRKAQRRKLRRKMAKTARKWAKKGVKARELAEQNDYEGIPYIVSVDFWADGALGPISVGASPSMPSCKKRR